jgi:phage terminase small subunit
MGARDARDARPLRFARFYFASLNATKAAEEAGYSARTAKQQGSRLLTRVDVQAELARLQKHHATANDISAGRVLEEYRRIAFARIDGALSFGPNGVTVKNSADLTPELLAAVSEVSEVRNVDGSVSVRLKFHSKADALAALRKHLGLDAPEKVEVSVDDKLQGALGKLSGVVKRVATPSRG